MVWEKTIYGLGPALYHPTPERIVVLTSWVLRVLHGVPGARDSDLVGEVYASSVPRAAVSLSFRPDEPRGCGPHEWRAEREAR